MNSYSENIQIIMIKQIKISRNFPDQFFSKYQNDHEKSS